MKKMTEEALVYIKKTKIKTVAATAVIGLALYLGVKALFGLKHKDS